MPAKPDINTAPVAEPSPASELISRMLIAMPTPPPHPPLFAASDDVAFDAWLRRALILAHDSVLQDPVPERLLRILQQPSQSS